QDDARLGRRYAARGPGGPDPPERRHRNRGRPPPGPGPRPLLTPAGPSNLLGQPANQLGEPAKLGVRHSEYRWQTPYLTGRPTKFAGWPSKWVRWDSRSWSGGVGGDGEAG